ncbi:MAG: four helix bundle protein [Peptococcaceae bacterium]|nr:four helix bundle protein [Peptococcaceae bacterium]
MNHVRPHYNLEAWKEAITLVKAVYQLTKDFPADELYGLTSQMRRCAISIPSNIAEGAARSSRKEFAQFLSVAKGSLSKLDTQLLIAVELGYMDHGS